MFSIKRRLIQSIKFRFVKLKYYLELVAWARRNKDLISDVQYIVKLRDTAQDNFLRCEREEKIDQMKKAEIQVNILNNIIDKYIKCH